MNNSLTPLWAKTVELLVRRFCPNLAARLDAKRKEWVGVRIQALRIGTEADYIGRELTAIGQEAREATANINNFLGEPSEAKKPQGPSTISGIGNG